MKFRAGFVSNSSTASFIISFKTSLSEKSIHDIIRKCEPFIDERWDEDLVRKSETFYSTMARSKNPSLEPVLETYIIPAYKKNLQKINSYTYSLTQDTSMFNDWYDISCWPFIKAISENRIDGIELSTILQTEEEYDSCNKQVNFDPEPWNACYEDEQKESNKLRNEHYIEYLEYLSKIQSGLTEKEKIDLSRSLLNK